MAVMIVFGFSYIAFAYLFGFLFEKSQSAYKGYPLIVYIFFSILPWLLATSFKNTAINQIFEMIFLIISPIFAMNRAYMYLSKTNSKILGDGLITEMNPIIGIMVAQFVVLMGLTIFIDSYRFKNFDKVKKASSKDRIIDAEGFYL